MKTCFPIAVCSLSYCKDKTFSEILKIFQYKYIEIRKMLDCNLLSKKLLDYNLLSKN